MADREPAESDDIARLNQLIVDGHEDAERHGAISGETLDRMLDDARAARHVALPRRASAEPGSQSRKG